MQYLGLDIRGQEKTIYYLGPAGTIPAMTVSQDGSAPVSVPASQTAEYASGQYKTVLTAAQMDATVVVANITFGGYQPVQIVVETQLDEPATAGSLANLAEAVEAAKAHTDALINTDLSAVAKTSDMTALAGEIITTLTPVNAAVIAAAEKAAIAYILPSISAVERTVRITVSGQPVEGIPVWLTQDAAGTVLMSPVKYTSAGGQAVFTVESGQTYYIQAAPPFSIDLPMPYKWKVI